VSNKSIGLSDELHAYLLRVGVREPDILRRLREETASLPMARMQIAPEEGAFLAVLAQVIDARSYLEVGTFTGYSSLAIALAMPDDARLVCCDISREWTDIARRYWAEAGVDERIDLRLARATKSLDALLAEGREGTFDLCFIDADKANYGDYYERALRLVRKGGLIAVDNVLWSGRVADEGDQDPDTIAMRTFNDALAQDERVALSLVPIADGVTLARKR
jgi:predicted O-methyltransferase YrrM